MNNTTKNYLIERGIKPSLQRIAIMDFLLKNRTHPTADDIYQALCDIIPTLSKTTVYNTLKLFTQQGAALSLEIDEKNVRFDGDTSVHAHFRCKCCGAIIDLPVDQVNMVDPKFLEGFVITEINAFYKGLCDKCNHEASLIQNKSIN